MNTLYNIEILDNFIKSCNESNSEISYSAFKTLNESITVNGKNIDIPEDVFEAYIKYKDFKQTIGIMEFAKIKDFDTYIAEIEAGEMDIDDEGEEDKTGDDAPELRQSKNNLPNTPETPESEADRAEDEIDSKNDSEEMAKPEETPDTPNMKQSGDNNDNTGEENGDSGEDRKEDDEEDGKVNGEISEALEDKKKN